MEEGRTLAQLDRAAIDDLIARGVAQGGMRAKLEAALVTLGAGVQRVRITDISGITDPTAGTAITLAGAAEKAVHS
jgi:acetylglutamate kinase